MTFDPLHTLADNPIAPAETCFPIVPDDAIELPIASKAIYVGTGGHVVLRSMRGSRT